MSPFILHRLQLVMVLGCTGVGTTEGWWGEPEFGPADSTVTVKEGDTAKLPCVVLNLNDKSVTWLRKRDLHILTAGHHTYSADQRFQVVHAEGSSEWTLVVRYAQLRDAGVYECQVNTQHKLSRPVTLKVYDPRQVVTKSKVFVANNTASTKDGHLRVEILGPRERHIEEGSSLTLTCVVTSNSGSPASLVYWYHDTSLIDYNSPRGGVNLRVDRGLGQTTTLLVVRSVGPGDSGMYSCVPQGSHPATVLVHVQKGEHEAAIQQGGLGKASPSSSPSSSFSSSSSSSSSASSSSSCFFILFCVFVLVLHYRQSLHLSSCFNSTSLSLFSFLFFVCPYVFRPMSVFLSVLLSSLISLSTWSFSHFLLPHCLTCILSFLFLLCLLPSLPSLLALFSFSTFFLLCFFPSSISLASSPVLACNFSSLSLYFFFLLPSPSVPSPSFFLST